MIVLLPPLFNYDLSLMSIDKDPAIQAVTAKRPVETLDEGIFPATTRCDVHRFAVPVAQSLLQYVGNELGTVIAAQVVGRTSQLDQPFQYLNVLA